MQEDTDYDAQTQTPSSSGQAHWYAHMRAFSLGYGCLEEQIEQCPKSFIPYIPEKLFERASSTGYLSTVDPLITSGKYQVDNQDSRRSKGTSFKEPEQRSKKHIRFNEVKGRAKQKTSIRFSDKPDVSWSMTEGGVITRTAPEQETKKNSKGAHDSAPAHSGKSVVQTEEESVDGQNDSHCTPLKDLIKEDLKENFCEILEKYTCDTCMKKELPHTFKGRKQLRKISTEQKLKKKYDSKSLYSEQPATKTVKKVEHEHGELQYVHLAEVIKKEFKVRTCEVLGKYETNVCPREEALPHGSKKKTRSKVEEKTSGYLYAPHFSSFEHRIAALRATAHVEPAPAACAGYAGDAAVDQQYLEAIKLISMLKLK
uniref:uncharacterized protein LOC125395707 isoform X3 n=1 Tax=Myodes glareolus TaxID=447135 RepID=UPI002021FA75|nr:uncharacterized protein LOC125395707 isoform X3 [Myodes glareolus]